MIRLPLQRLKEGMIMAQSIFNCKGASLLTKGTKLNQQYILKLRQMGISYVSVVSTDPKSRIMPPDDIIQDETRQLAVTRLFDFYKKVEKNGLVDVAPLQNVSEQIIIDLITQPNSIVQMTDIRLFDDYTFSHSMNVAALSALMGVGLKLDQNDLMDLTLGALLHDLGKLDVPKVILSKPSALTDEEFNIVKTHPVSGYQKLMNMGLKNLNVHLLATIARQHHERIDGKGYPDQLKGGQIHKFAQIVAVADVYDALTSSRSYKKAYPPHIAYKIMTKCSGQQFNESILEIFFEHVALYPVGSLLKTKSGIGIVKDVHQKLTKFPQIVIFADSAGNLLSTPVEIDTADQLPDFIETVMENSEVIALTRQLGIDPAVFIAE